MITSKHNQDQQLKYLAAQRQLYRISKRVFTANLVISGPMAAASTILIFFAPCMKGYAALWGSIATLLSLFWLSPWQKRLQSSAAGVQELFDCEVLNLPWNDLKSGRRPDPELVKEYSDEYDLHSQHLPKLNDWYPAEISRIPEYIGRLICQRSNCRWDHDLRRRYSVWLIGCVFAILILAVVLGQVRGMTIEDWTLKIVAPLSSTFVFVIRQLQDLKESSTRLNGLKEYAETLWKKALSGHSENEITTASRGLQDEIYENRKRSPLVFDWVYRSLQSKHEDQMNHTAEVLVREYMKNALER